ncbi:MAG: cyclic nucleotide-binding domain-containing protein [Pseudomonadales bacterium]
MNSNTHQTSIDSYAPASGSILVKAGDVYFLVGQPPEVLKGLMRHSVDTIHALVLTDTREHDGSLLHNVEFMLYHFLFVSQGLSRGEKLALIGPQPVLDQVRRIIQITLLGPDEHQLVEWGTEKEQRDEWLAVAQATALKSDQDTVLTVDDLLSYHPFTDDQTEFQGVSVIHLGLDHYQFTAGDQQHKVRLEATPILPAYPLQEDYLSGRLAKFSVEVLGGASGFSPNEPCTGLALCYNGDYVLIDAIPFLDVHLRARGIAKNQVSACVLTHIHDDHCSMFPLMLSPHRIEIITAPEIFNMAMEKLALGLNWEESAVREHFIHIPTNPDQPLNYYGMRIEPHYTVHSIPTMGATFTSNVEGHERSICVVGDNHSLAAISTLVASGSVQPHTLDRLRALYQQPFDLLIADGGAGVLHGNPAEFVDSKAERVVFVHVESLPEAFRATFSVASAGKSYTVIPGDDSLYLSLINHYLSQWVGDPVPMKWMRSLIAGAKLMHYNQEDVILVQGDETGDKVFLLLTGYCDVVHQANDQWRTVAELQAGDLIGEMAVITDIKTRNASVVASTPVTLAVFSENIFSSLAGEPSFKAGLLKRWRIRPHLKALPIFNDLSSTVIENIGTQAHLEETSAGTLITPTEQEWWILIEGEVTEEERSLTTGQWGWRPFQPPKLANLQCQTNCQWIRFDRDAFETLRLKTPQLNYRLRTIQQQSPDLLS